MNEDSDRESETHQRLHLVHEPLGQEILASPAKEQPSRLLCGSFASYRLVLLHSHSLPI